MPKQNPSQDINVTVQGDAQLKGVAIGNDNQIITEAAANNIVQAQNSTVTIVGGHQIDIQVYSLAASEQGNVDWAAYRKALHKARAQPYKFLQYYETTDADRFFGRNALCDHIINKLIPSILWTVFHTRVALFKGVLQSDYELYAC